MLGEGRSGLDVDEKDTTDLETRTVSRSASTDRGWRELLPDRSESLASDRATALGFLGNERVERSDPGELDVLLVEDTDVDAQVTTVLLRRALDNAVTVTRARTVRDALSDLRAQRFDLILLDMGLPDGRGMDVLERISDAAPNATIIILSGNDDRHLAVASLREGAQDYLIKGTFDPETFGRTLRHAVARTEAELHARWATAKLLLRSDQLAAEIERRKSVERRLRAEALRVGEANVRLRELDRAKSLFLANVSHELRTPLCSISGYAELLDTDLRDADDPAVDQALDAINRNCGRLLTLVEQLLVTGRLESGLQPPVLRLTDLRSMLWSCVDVVSPVMRQQIEVDVPVVADVLMDAGQIERVVINLLDNARKFAPVDSTITISAGETADGSSVWVAVADEGPGVSASEQATLFASFTRGEQAIRDAVEGTGLGLGIAKHIVDAHGGDLSLHSVEGRGATFTMTIPIAGPVVEPVERPMVQAIDAP